MPITADDPGRASRPRPDLTIKGIDREDINPDAMDSFVVRIFIELNRQLCLMENLKDPEKLADPALRERHARILANLERTMERLAKVEAGRAAQRKSKVMTKDGQGGRKALEARIDRILAIEFERAAADRAER